MNILTPWLRFQTEASLPSKVYLPSPALCDSFVFSASSVVSSKSQLTTEDTEYTEKSQEGKDNAGNEVLTDDAFDLDSTVMAEVNKETELVTGSFQIVMSLSTMLVG